MGFTKTGLPGTAGIRRALAVGATVGCVAACGSASGTTSDSAASSSGGASQHSAAYKMVEAQYAQYHAPQPPITVPALPAKPATGKSVAIMTCPLPTCANVADPAESAAKALGWHTTLVNSPITPQGYVSAVGQMEQAKPNFAVIIPFFPNTLITKQLASLQGSGAKVVEVAGGQTPSTKGPVEGETSGSPELAESGHLMGVAVAHDAGGAAQTLFVWDPDLASSWQPVLSSFKSVIQANGGSVGVLNISEANVGTKVPSEVTSYVQSHPNIKYIAFAVSDLAAGVPSALKAAGVATNVKIISRAPTATTMADIADGSEWATVGEEVGASGYRSIDQLARLNAGVALGDLTNPVGWHEIYTKSNLPVGGGVPQTPGVPSAFLKAWHAS